MSMAGSGPSTPPLSPRKNDEGTLVGSNFATCWGSVGFFGPLTTRPDFWDGGIGQRLVAAACDQLDAWGVRHAGLFTFAQSAKHVGLYGKFGFHPRFLTAIMTAPARARTMTSAASRYSALPEGKRQEAENACRELTEELYPGLDLRRRNPHGGGTRARRHGFTVGSSQPAHRLCRLPLGPGERSRRRLLLRQIWRGATGTGRRGPPRCAARHLRLARARSRRAECSRWGEPGARRSLSTNAGARLPDDYPRRDDAPAERARL